MKSMRNVYKKKRNLGLLSAHVIKTTEQISLKTMGAFMPPNATSLLWLTDQGVVATFMALYCISSN